MKKISLLIPAICLFSAITVFAQQSKIDGRVVNSQGGGIPGTLVSCGGGQRTTDSRGNFTIYFEIGPGRPVQCDVRKSGWTVYSPAGGGLTTQDLSKTFDPRLLRIAPRGSNLFLSDSALSNLADKIPVENAKLRGENAALKGQLQSTKQIAAKRLTELNNFEPVKKFAQESGLPVQKVVASLIEWARLTKSTDDKLRQIRSAYILGDTDTVIRLTRENDADAEKGFDEASREYLERSRAFISNKKFQGSAYFDKGEYRGALKSFKEVFEKNFWKEVLEDELSDIEFLSAATKYMLAVGIEGEEALAMLSESSANYRKLLTYYTREKRPSDWALTQNNLGVVLIKLGEKLEGEASINALRESEKAIRLALEVYNRQTSAQNWAMAQNNLGAVLNSLGERLQGEAGINTLMEAEKAIRLAQQVYTRQSLTHAWATTQINLSNVLRSLGEKLEGEVGINALRESEKAVRLALEVKTRQSSAQDWSDTQINLSNVLRSLGEKLEGEASVNALRESEKALRLALEVRTRQSSAQDWSKTQINLGIVLRSLGQKLEGEAGINALLESEEALRLALEVRTRQSSSADWAGSNLLIGLNRADIAAQTKGPEKFEHWKRAADAFENSLLVVTREHSSGLWTLLKRLQAQVNFELNDFKKSAASYAELFAVDQNDKNLYQILGSLYHETIFDHAASFELHKNWLARHPEDVSTQADFAESHFTTGRFIESGQWINKLLTNSEVSASSKTALRGIEIASLVALGERKTINEKLEALIAEVSKEPKEFKVGWSFNGSKNYIGQSKELAQYKGWLEKLFDAIKSPDRDAIIAALTQVKAEFKK